MIELRHVHSFDRLSEETQAPMKGEPKLNANSCQAKPDDLEYTKGLNGLRKAYEQVKNGETEDYHTAMQVLIN